MSDQDLVRLFSLDRLPVARPGRYMFCAFVINQDGEHATLLTWFGHALIVNLSSAKTIDGYVWSIPMSAAHAEGMI